MRKDKNMKKFNDKVVVLVAVFNGEKYLRELLDSILGNSHKNYKIVLSDDLSSDSSLDIIKEYADKYEMIEHYESGKKFGSAPKHFLHLLCQYKDSDYIMFCDQDDVWDCDKIELTLNAMKNGENGPRLVHTDSVVTDDNLKTLFASYHKMLSLKDDMSFAQRLIENNVQGATTMINRELAELCAVEDDRVVMHDWFVALIASAIGEIIYVPKTTMKYRQHSSNVVGATDKPESLPYILKRLKTDIRDDILRSRQQSSLVVETIGDKMSDSDKNIAETFANGSFKNKVERMYEMNKFGIIPNSFLKKIKFLLWG